MVVVDAVTWVPGMFQISENAARLIKKMTLKNGIPEGGLRIGIKAGGCSGLSYTFGWEAVPRDGDHVFDGPEGVVGVTESATDGSKLIFKVTESIEPANVGPDAITTVEKNAIGNRLADDLLDQLVSQLQTVYPVSVNQSVIDRALAR